MATLKWVIVTIVIGYGALIALIYLAQRALMYFPERARTPPTAAGLPQATEVILHTGDGEHIVAWQVAAADDQPVVIYFHGNGGALRLRATRFRALVRDGIGLVAVSYRGYGGSTGRPSETGLKRDAEAAYDFAVERYGAGRIVLWGESLGSAVAVALAAERPVRAVVLEAPFTSAVDIAAAIYPFVPVRQLMSDQFRSDQRIGRVTAPVLVLHGDHDDVVPIGFGERLYAMIGAPKRFVRLAGGGHSDLDAHGALEAVRAFIAGPPNAAVN